MAEHSVQVVETPTFEVVNKDLQILIQADGNTFGHLTVSRGGIGWKSSSEKLERHFTWEQFAQLVERQYDA